MVAITRILMTTVLGSLVVTQALCADHVARARVPGIPSLQTDNGTLNYAFRIAIGDLLGNVAPYESGLLEGPAPVVYAGLDYGKPWTRDASINAWNAASLLIPDVSRDTLLSVLMRSDDGVRIGGQYWDAIVWASGAWHHYLVTGDKHFLGLALDAVTNSLAYFERTEFNSEYNLFHGPGWSDGVAAYPDAYAAAGGSSAILAWPRNNPDRISKPGYGIPMMAISTNCLYYNAYRMAEKMASALSVPPNLEWDRKASELKKAINKHLWNEEKGIYRFLIGPLGSCDHQEALGHAYAILFGVADSEKTEAIFQNQHVTTAGVPSTWPTFPRYESDDGTSFGRHSGTVWPQIQGFWADAAARCGKTKIFAHELFQLAGHAVRDKQFAEIYHPITGAIYGGMQEAGERGIIQWNATSRQTWAATAYLRMVLLGVVGMRFEEDGLRFQPCVPEGVSRIVLRGLRYREMDIDVTVEGNGSTIQEFRVNGQSAGNAHLPSLGKGNRDIVIVMGKK